MQVQVHEQEDVTHLGAPAQERWSPAPSRIAAGRREPLPLTRREREVLALLQGRLTDREIADSLCIGVRTAECHVARVLAKLGVASRRDAAAVASWLGLA